MQLLPKDQLIRTGPVDHADWNYRPLLSWVARRRFSLVLQTLGAFHAHCMLEIGFGSGVFMPELKRRCDELYGIDVHERVAEVESRLRDAGVTAHLSNQDAAATGFPDRFFGAVVAISSLEFIANIEAASAELARIMTPEGRLVAVMPSKSPLLDCALSLVTGENAEHDYGERRERVLPALKRHFRIARTRRFLTIYTAYELRPLEPSG